MEAQSLLLERFKGCATVRWPVKRGRGLFPAVLYRELPSALQSFYDAGASKTWILMMYLFILDSLGSTEVLVILGAALIFFGPRKLPQLSRQLGKSLSEFRRASDDFKRTWEREVNLDSYDKGAEPDYGNSILEKATDKIRAAREAAALDASPSTAAVAPAVTPIDSALVQPRDVATAAEPAPPDQPGGKHDWP